MPFFSVIIPTYNRAYMLPKAIESVITQTFTDWELIIVDDGSKDSTKELVESYIAKDKRIKYIYQENAERSAARNNGINHASGEYICFLDSDDYYLPQKLQSHYETIAKNKFQDAVYYEGIIFEDIDTKEQSKIELPIQKKDENIFEFLIQNPLGSMQLGIPKELIKRELFNTNFKIGEDVELWIRLANQDNFKPIHTYNSIALEHTNRTVGFKNSLAVFQHLQTIQFIINKNPSLFSTRVKNKVVANSCFNIAKYYMQNNQKTKAIIWIFKAVFKDSKNQHLKHWTYCIKELLILQRIPKEYKRL